MATWQDTITADTRTQGGVTALIAKTHEAMIAVGCVQTDDTGQLDLDSYPPIVSGTTTNHGYRVYELNDSESAEHPVFIKLEFVTRRNGNPDCLMLETWVTVGFATDGAGQVLAPRAVANTPNTGYPGGSGLVPAVTSNAPCFACKHDGFLFLLVGCGYMKYSGGSNIPAQTAAVFAISHHPRGITLFHSHNVHATQAPSASNPNELAHTVVDRVSEVTVGPYQRTLPMVQPASAGGSIIAVPALVCGAQSAWFDPNIVSVPVSAVSLSTTVELSLDDVEDATYLVLPQATAANAAGLVGRIVVTADYRDVFGRAIAVRWE